MGIVSKISIPVSMPQSQKRGIGLVRVERYSEVMSYQMSVPKKRGTEVVKVQRYSEVMSYQIRVSKKRGIEVVKFERYSEVIYSNISAARHLISLQIRIHKIAHSEIALTLNDFDTDTRLHSRVVPYGYHHTPSCNSVRIPAYTFCAWIRIPAYTLLPKR